MSILRSLSGLPRGYWLVALLGAATLAFSVFSNHDCFALRADGAGWQAYVDYQTLDRAPYSQLGVDAHQGDFDAYYPIDSDYTIPGALVRLVGGTGPRPIQIYIIYAAALFACVLFMAEFYCRSLPIAFLSAFVGTLFCLPFIVGLDAPTFRFIPLNPHWMQLIILSTLTIVALWHLDGQWSISRVIAIFLPAACVYLEIFSVGAMIIFTPAIAIYGGSSFLFHRQKSALIQKVLSGIFLISVLAITGAATYIYGMIHYSAYFYFGNEFDWVPPIKEFMAIGLVYPFGTLLICLGVVGAIVALFDNCRRLRQLALTHLVATAVFWIAVAAVYYYSVNYPYRGSGTLYFETTFIPFAAMFVAVGITKLPVLLLRWLRLRRASVERWLNARFPVLALCALLVAVLAHNIEAWQAGLNNYCTAQQQYNMVRPTKITQALENKAAIAPGKIFEGNIITIDRTDILPLFSTSFSSVDMNNLNDLRRRETGNEHRLYGLWHFRLPTMYQYFTFITAPYYLLLTEFLAPPEVLQTRSELVLTRIDAKMLRLWGVRFVITDQDYEGGQQLASIPAGRDGILRLVELPDANLGDFSPTTVEQVANFHDGLSIMHQPAFDGSRTVVADAPIDGALVPATNTRLTYETYGFHLEAESPGTSILVLPVQFSHCWTVSNRKSTNLFRANLMQLGIKFSGKLDVRLVFRFGPFFASHCRLEDVTDMNRLDIKDGRVIPRKPPHRLF